MSRAAHLTRRDDLAEDIIFCHDEGLHHRLSPREIAYYLHAPYTAVLAVLTEHYAGLKAEADAVRLAELPPSRLAAEHVEAGSSRDTHTPRERRAA
jgi:hypothetical protein